MTSRRSSQFPESLKRHAPAMRPRAGFVLRHVFADFVQDNAQKRGRLSIEHWIPVGNKA
jgi:hypothetical protein